MSSLAPPSIVAFANNAVDCLTVRTSSSDDATSFVVSLWNGAFRIAELGASRNIIADHPIAELTGRPAFKLEWSPIDVVREMTWQVGLHMSVVASTNISESCLVRALEELKKQMRASDGVPDDTMLFKQTIAMFADSMYERVGFAVKQHAFFPHEHRPKTTVWDMIMPLKSYS